MRPDASPNACWTSFVGAPMHDLGALSEKCLTCDEQVQTKEAKPMTVVEARGFDSTGPLLGALRGTP